MIRRLLTATLAVILAALAAAGPAPAANRPLVTAVADSFVDGPDWLTLLDRIHGSGATAVRFWVTWADIAPAGAVKPQGFDASNYADPGYRWASTDRALQAVVASGLQPILTISDAPAWAERHAPGDQTWAAGERLDGTVRPDPGEFGAFAQAITTRYSGTVPGLPRVRWWQPWNEPNHHNDLNPQFDIAPDKFATADTPLLAPALYRQLLRSFATAAKRVRADNVIVAGGLAPFFRPEPGGRAASPLTFMRALLCMDARDRPKASCPGGPLPFDVWSQHPYTSGNAWHHANSPYDVSLGDMPKVVKLLRAAEKAGRIASHGRVRLWVTEFSWDSNPPDPYGVPSRLLTRWVAEALHQLWLDRVELVTWFQVRDAPDISEGGVFQSGLYLRCKYGLQCDKPKPMLAAWRFPFTAYRSRGRVNVWGRTPSGRPGSVRVEQRRSGRWIRLAGLRTDRNGIFAARGLRLHGRGDVRARLPRRGSARSAPFSLHRPPDHPVNPFGNTPPNEQ
jgi:hypothetical protein